MTYNAMWGVLLGQTLTPRLEMASKSYITWSWFQNPTKTRFLRGKTTLWVLLGLWMPQFSRCGGEVSVPQARIASWLFLYISVPVVLIIRATIRGLYWRGLIFGNSGRVLSFPCAHKVRNSLALRARMWQGSQHVLQPFPQIGCSISLSPT